MKILFVGDVVGVPGRRILRSGIRKLRKRHEPDLIVANGENVARGAGLTPATADQMFQAGCDVVTTGNHVWDRGEITPYLEKHPRLLRPANYPRPAAGSGVFITEARNGVNVAVVNLMGRVFMGDAEDPFRTADAVLRELEGRAPVVIIDFHAEATSEKIAFGWYLDGRVAAVIGTHTHVPTADERVLPGGTAYITDVGMTGPYDSVIGVEKEKVIQRFLTQRPIRYTPANADVRLAGVLIELTPSNGRALSIRRILLEEGKAEEYLGP